MNDLVGALSDCVQLTDVIVIIFGIPFSKWPVRASGRPAYPAGTRAGIPSMSSVNLERTRTGQRSRSGSSFLQWSPIIPSLAVFALALFCSPLASQSLQFDRAAVAGGELWRVFTGHFTHWNLEDLFWDVSVFAVLGVLCERRNHGRYLLCLPAAAAAISLGVWLVLPNIETYRGLSGINSALFTLLAGRVLAERWLAKDLGWVTILASLIVGFGLKLADLGS